jgi:hypothetical protein
MKIGIFMSFSVQQESIAETICKKKDIPDNCCHGKCYLNAQFKKIDQGHADAISSEQQEKKKTTISYEVLQHFFPTTIEHYSNASLNWIFMTKNRPYFSFQTTFGYHFVPSLLKPPQQSFL